MKKADIEEALQDYFEVSDIEEVDYSMDFIHGMYKEVTRTSGGRNLCNSGMMLVQSATKVLDITREYFIHDIAVDREDLIIRLGAVLHDFTRISYLCGISIEEVIEAHRKLIEGE